MNAPHFLSLYVLHYSIACLFIQVLNSYKFLTGLIAPSGTNGYFYHVYHKPTQRQQSGIGTYTIPQVATPLYSAYSKTLDLMFAKNLNFHVMSGYKFLMQNCTCSYFSE